LVAVKDTHGYLLVSAHSGAPAGGPAGGWWVLGVGVG